MRIGSFIGRIARGGVLAAGITMLLGGCEVAGTGGAEQGLMARGEGGGDLDPGAPEAASGSGIVMCSAGAGGFSDIVVDESEVAAHLAAGDILGDCSQFFCGGS